MKQNTDAIKVNLDDPSSQRKILTLQGINRMSDLVSNNSRDMRNQLMFLLTVFVGILTSYFISKGYVSLTILMLNFLLLTTIFYIRGRKKQESQFIMVSRNLLKDAKKQNIRLPGVDY